MARGNGKHAIFHIEDDYRRMVDGLSKTVGRTDWEVFAYVWMPNHIHLFLRTPKPNLSKGMQYLLSGYANWYAKRHQRTGHLFQGRFRAELVEDESYFWTLSRYLHLNPVRGKRPIVAHPRDWPWSSYPGFCSKAKQVDWIEYDGVLNAWQAGTWLLCSCSKTSCWSVQDHFSLNSSSIFVFSCCIASACCNVFSAFSVCR